MKRWSSQSVLVCVGRRVTGSKADLGELVTAKVSPRCGKPMGQSSLQLPAAKS